MIILKEESLGSIPTPATGKATIFVDSADGIAKKKSDSGVVSNLEPTTALVDSVFGRGGDVVAQNGDYSASQITGFDAATDARIALQSGAANGLAELDGSSQVPIAQIPNSIITKILTGLSVSWGQLLSSDSILQAFQKLSGMNTMSQNEVSSDVTVPTGHTWLRQNRTLFSGTTKITLSAGSKISFIG